MRKPGRWIAIVGFFLCLLWKIFFLVDWPEFSIGFSLLVLVPLLLEEAMQDSSGSPPEKCLWQLVTSILPFSVAGGIALTLPVGWEAAVWGSLWLLFTLSVSICGLWRLYLRGKHSPEEWTIDIGFLYLGTGGVCFFLSLFPWGGFGYFSQKEMIVLTLFFHGAAFLFSLITGFFGRYRLRMSEMSQKKVDRPYRCQVRVVLISPLFIFISLWYGASLFLLAAAFYVLLIIWMCGWWFWLSIEFKPWVRTALLLTILMGVSIIGSVFLKGWSVGRLSGVGVIAMVPPYGYFTVLLFSWLIVFAWRNVDEPRQLLPVHHLGKGEKVEKSS